MKPPTEKRTIFYVRFMQKNDSPPAGGYRSTQRLAIHSAAMLAALAGLVLALMLLAGLRLTALLLLAGFVLTALLRVTLLLLWVALWILLFIRHFETLWCLGLLGGVSLPDRPTRGMGVGSPASPQRLGITEKTRMGRTRNAALSHRNAPVKNFHGN
jgi:hypothetical protein